MMQRNWVYGAKGWHYVEMSLTLQDGQSVIARWWVDGMPVTDEAFATLVDALELARPISIPGTPPA